MNRKEILIDGICKNQLGLISDQAFAPRSKRRKSTMLEYLIMLQLKNWLKNISVRIWMFQKSAVDNIVWGERIPEMIKNEKFDFILASHIIEFVPEIIWFLEDCETVQKPDEELRIAIPVKRFCFDYLRECASRFPIKTIVLTTIGNAHLWAG